MFNLAEVWGVTYQGVKGCNWKTSQNESETRISLPIGTNRKPLAAIGKLFIAIGKLMIGKTLAINGEEITNAMIGNDVLAIYW